MLILDLLKHAASGDPQVHPGPVLLELQRAPAREFNWAIDAGLGPLLYHWTHDHYGTLPADRQAILHSAHLTELVRSEFIRDCARQVIEAAAAVGTEVTLLKGISISDQYYPKPHHRKMSDIDVLVPVKLYSAIESNLLRRGFLRSLDEEGPGMHHGPPLHDPERQTWVELHHAFYPASSGLLSGETFDISRIEKQSVASQFQGMPVRRLSDELQLVYIASSWIWDLTLCGVHPSFVIALFDAVYLQRATRTSLDWGRVLASADNDRACASLYVLLSYLVRHGLCEVPVLARLASQQHMVGHYELRAMHAMLDRYLTGGRPWPWPLPPPVPGRYDLRRQLRKRLLRQ